MTLTEISKIRIISQKIGATEFKTAPEVVRWMGAVQAQDYPMAKWALGIRARGSDDEKIEAAFNKGEILRTHLMRPTLHFVSSEDIYWMLDLTAPRIKSSMKSRQKELELSEAIFTKSRSVLEKILCNGTFLTREELSKEFGKAKIKAVGNRLYHLLVRSELDGLICSGPVKEGKQTFALLRERVPVRKVLTRDESLAELATRYFTSHCPAALNDFIWWSGLSVKDAKRGFESVKSCFTTEIIGNEKYLFPESFHFIKNNIYQSHLLPAYDEFLISYRDRSASISLVDNKKAISSNGIFYPLIVTNGQVTGLWKRFIKKSDVTIELTLFRQPDKPVRSQIEKSATAFAQFLNKRLEIILKR